MYVITKKLKKKLDGITVEISDHIDVLESRVADRDAILAERDEEIERLEDELEVLKFNACSKCRANMTDMG